MKKINFNSTTVWPFNVNDVETWAYYNNVFSKEECEKIISIGNKIGVKEATLGKEGKNKKIRDSKVSWIYPNNESIWIYRRITEIVSELNNKFFKFDLYGFIEGLQFTHYQEPGGNYKKHMDSFLGGFTRKLSLTVQLSEPSSYKGGDLLLHTGPTPTVCPKEQGKLISFPSYILHEVKPVIKGERYSLVAWITGPQFK